jgi:hypothetical protein
MTHPAPDQFDNWTTSSYTAGSGQCVEIATLPGWGAVRDTKDRGGPALTFTATAHRAWITAAKTGRLDLKS